MAVDVSDEGTPRSPVDLAREQAWRDRQAAFDLPALDPVVNRQAHFDPVDTAVERFDTSDPPVLGSEKARIHAYYGPLPGYPLGDGMNLDPQYLKWVEDHSPLGTPEGAVPLESGEWVVSPLAG